MVEIQKDSTLVEQKKIFLKLIVNRDTSLKKSDSSCCSLYLDEARLRDILENIPSAVMVVEKPDAKVTYANK